MSKNPVVNMFDSFLVWLPILAIVIGIGWVGSLGIAHLEMTTHGSEVFVGNHETPNLTQAKMAHPVNTRTEAGLENLMLDAYAAGDPYAMQLVFARHNA